MFALAGWLITHATALAQVATKPGPPRSINSMTYVAAYFLVILGVGLGILFVCRSSNRRERARPEQFESKNLVEEE
jgi:hypothetical protein